LSCQRHSHFLVLLVFMSRLPSRAAIRPLHRSHPSAVR
jgi:hypothetical protein